VLLLAGADFLGLRPGLSAAVFSVQATSIQTTREITAVLPFGAVLAARMLADRVLAIRLAPAVLLLVLAGYLGGLGYELAQPSVPAQNHQLTSWLEAHHLTGGLSGYWEANVVTLASADHVRVRVVTAEGARLLRYKWNTDAAWYDPRSQTANFIVFGPPSSSIRVSPLGRPCSRRSASPRTSTTSAPIRCWCGTRTCCVSWPVPDLSTDGVVRT
jgi:hypothetical protein